MDKKKNYIQPLITSYALQVESLMVETSTETESTTGNKVDGPSNGGDGGASELNAKEHYFGEDFDVWNTWK